MFHCFSEKASKCSIAFGAMKTFQSLAGDLGKPLFRRIGSSFIAVNTPKKGKISAIALPTFDRMTTNSSSIVLV